MTATETVNPPGEPAAGGCCEGDLIERALDIPTPAGTVNTFITRPKGDGPYPVDLFYMGAPGKQQDLHDMARRIAIDGYFVIAEPVLPVGS